MLLVMRWLRCLRTRLGVHDRSLFTSGPGFERINASHEVDEECLPHYKFSRFYPVYLRDILESRYQVLSKLGYGSCSTVWLSRDMMFVTFPSHISYLSSYIYSASRSTLPWKFVSLIIQVSSANVLHMHIFEKCLGHTQDLRKPRFYSQNLNFQDKGGHIGASFSNLWLLIWSQREPLFTLMKLCSKLSLSMCLVLWKFCTPKHTWSIVVRHSFFMTFVSGDLKQKDLRAENFCLTALDQTSFQTLETSESIYPSARKIYSDRTIYRAPDQIIPQLLGAPVLCDFGEARFGQECYEEFI